MSNTVQLTKNGQPIFPVTDVSLVIGLQDAIKLPPVKTATLPTASAETAGKIYYVGPTNGEYERYITSAVNGSYEWIDLGSTAIPLPSIADNLTTDDSEMALSAAQGKVLDGKVSQLGQKVSLYEIPITATAKYIPTNAGVGQPIGAVTSSSVWEYMRYPVSQGDVIIVNGTGGGTPRLWCFVDANGIILSASDASVSGSNLLLTAPANSAEVILNVLIASAGTSYFIKKDSVYVDIVALKKESIVGWILAETFTATSVTRNSDGEVTSANVVWPDAKTGSLTITRDSDGNSTQMVATHGSDSYTLVITRNTDGDVTSTSIS